MNKKKGRSKSCETVKNMLSMIRLLHGERRITNEELKKFQKGDTIWGNDTDPEELKRWTIEEEEEAEEELENLYCKSVEYNEYLTDIEEYALEYFNADENGEFIEGSDFELAQTKYMVNYNTGAGEEDAYSIEEAKKLAELGICYTQQSIDIFDREKEETIATLPWYGVKPGDDDEPIEEIGGGFYGQWVDCL